LGQIDFSIRIFNQTKRDIENKVKMVSDLEENILIVEATPILSIASLKDAIKNKKGLLVKADVNKISSIVISALEEISKKMPVVIFGKQQTDQLPDGFIVVSNMTLEASIIKLMWSLKQVAAPTKIKDLMHKNVAGEIII
jgi:L-asparaginase/Glu-tRNA(Gln) amidotransferase subunit D